MPKMEIREFDRGESFEYPPDCTGWKILGEGVAEDTVRVAFVVERERGVH